MKLIPVSEQKASHSEDGWLDNDDQSLLNNLVESHQTDDDRPEHQTGQIYQFNAVLFLKRSEYGFIATEDKQEYFLNHGDVLALPQIRFRVELEKKTLSHAAKNNPLMPHEQTNNLTDDIWAMTTIDQPSTPNPDSNHGLDFLYEKPAHQQFNHLYDSTGQNTPRVEQNIDLNSVIPLNPINALAVPPATEAPVFTRSTTRRTR